MKSKKPPTKSGRHTRPLALNVNKLLNDSAIAAVVSLAASVVGEKFELFPHWTVPLAILSIAILAISGVGKVVVSTFSRGPKAVMIMFVLAVAVSGSVLIHQKEEALELKEPEGLLVPGNWPNPEIPCGPQNISADANNIPADALKIYFGNSVVSFATKFPHTVIQLADQEAFVMDRRKGGVSISFRVFGDDGRIIARIDNNKFKRNEHTTFEQIRPDEHTLIVHDDKDNEVLNIRYLNPSAIKILGVFSYPQVKLSITDDRVLIDYGLRQRELSDICLGLNSTDIGL